MAGKKKNVRVTNLINLIFKLDASIFKAQLRLTTPERDILLKILVPLTSVAIYFLIYRDY